MPNIYVSSAKYAAVPAWTASTVYSSASNGGRGDYVRQLATPAVGSERVFRCTTGGTSGGSEPAWTVTKNATTTDNTVVWTECTGQEADQASGNWKAPHASLSNAAAWGAAGDTFFVGKTHAWTQAAAMTIAVPGTLAAPCTVLCVDEAGSVPPVAADVSTGATETTTSLNAMTVSPTFAHIEGIAFSCASGANNRSLTIGAGTCDIVFKNCKLQLGGTSGGQITFGGGSSTQAGRITLDNTSVQVAAPTSGLAVSNMLLRWRNTPNAVTGATLPATLFISSAPQNSQNVVLEGVDLSAMGSGKTLVGAISANGEYILKDTKLNGAVTVAATPTTSGMAVYAVRSDSAGVNYRTEAYRYAGTQTVETALVRALTDATDGLTALSWKVSTTANAKFLTPMRLMPMAVFNTVTGANVTATIYGVWNAAALPNNDDIAFDLEYLGSASSPLGSFATSGRATVLSASTPLSASTKSWDSSGVAARANSTAYSVGQVIKLASNPGRVFFCTTGGTSAASEPAGYASAADGGSVTDGTATFRAAVRFQMAVTLSTPQPAMIGPMYAYVSVFKPSSTFWIDPSPVLS